MWEVGEHENSERINRRVFRAVVSVAFRFTEQRGE